MLGTVPEHEPGAVCCVDVAETDSGKRGAPERRAKPSRKLRRGLRVLLSQGHCWTRTGIMCGVLTHEIGRLIKESVGTVVE